MEFVRARDVAAWGARPAAARAAPRARSATARGRAVGGGAVRAAAGAPRRLAPGDHGFDPLGLATTDERLAFMAEAEVKHARIAAVRGGPAARRALALGPRRPRLPDALADGGRAPSVLNGNLGASAGFLAAVFLGAAAAETFTVQRRWRRDDPDGYSPGELGFDPLGMYGDAPAKRKSMRAAELANGRLAMVAVLGYVLLEAGSHQPVAGLTPALFAPPWETPRPLRRRGELAKTGRAGGRGRAAACHLRAQARRPRGVRACWCTVEFDPRSGFTTAHELGEHPAQAIRPDKDHEEIEVDDGESVESLAERATAGHFEAEVESTPPHQGAR